MKRAGNTESPPGLSLTVQYASGRQHLPTRAQFRRWIKAALQRDAIITLRIVDEPEGRELNRTYRGRDYATNVLTFVYDDMQTLAGDIVICAPVVAREAREQRKSFDAHWAHIVVHGVLHLLGFDHENEEQARTMEDRERKILAGLGFRDPYALRD